LGDVKGAWADELYRVLWAYHTTPQSATKETSFRLTYRADAMISIKLGQPSLCWSIFNADKNKEAMWMELDMVKEGQEIALINIRANKQKSRKKRNSFLRLQSFKPGDLYWYL